MQKKYQNNPNSIDLVSPHDKELQKFRLLLEELTSEYIKKFEDIQRKKTEDIIPINIFNKKLSPLETIVKYLKENLNFSFKKISELLNRSVKTVWQAYKNSKKKYNIIFEYKDSPYNLPISILKNRDFSILEHIVSFLKENYALNYHDISVLLNRDERTIWTIYKRVKEKRK